MNQDNFFHMNFCNWNETLRSRVYEETLIFQILDFKNLVQGSDGP
jgi:hypothetical protein